METMKSSTERLDWLYRRFGNRTTFERYWFANCFVAHDGRKVPYVGDARQNSLQYASATDPSTWRDPSNVFGAWLADKTGTLVGIGFVLHGDGTVCIDLDKVVDEQGNISQEAQRILDRFPNTYAEYSLSGRGIHIWLRTTKPLPVDGRRTGNVEIYQDKRYIAITMDILPGRPQDIADYTDELHSFYRELFGDDDHTPPTDDGIPPVPSDAVPPAPSTSDAGDDALIARFRRNPINDILWRGGKLPDHKSLSEADCALAVRLLWYTDGNAERAYRLFWRSDRVLRDKIRKRPDLVVKAINKAYQYYTYAKSKEQQRRTAQRVNLDDWNITQPYPCSAPVGTYTYGAEVCAAVLGGAVVFDTEQNSLMVYNEKTGLWEKNKYLLYEMVKRVLLEHYKHLAQRNVISKKELDKILKNISNGVGVRGVIGRLKYLPELMLNRNNSERIPISSLHNNQYYRDSFLEWFENRVKIDPNGVVPNSLAYESYYQYACSMGREPLSYRRWSDWMDQKQIPAMQKTYNGKVMRCRVGITLTEQDDPFVKWFTKCVQRTPDAVVPNEQAYQHYCDYVRSIGQTPESMKKWAQRMDQKGVPIVRTMHNGKQTRCRKGIKLLPSNN